MDIVNIRKKAKKEKEEKTKEKTTQTEITSNSDTAGKEKDEELKIAEVEGKTSEMTRVQEVESPSARPDIMEIQEKAKVETYEIPSVTLGDEEDTVEIISFNLGEETYGVKIDHVKEILNPLEITPVPRTPDYLEGVTSLRGEIIPVFDLKKRLGLESIKEERKRRILILSVRNETMGALIDKVSGVVKLRRDSIEPPPTIITGTEADFLEGVSRIDDKFIGLLNIEEVMKI